MQPAIEIRIRSNSKRYDIAALREYIIQILTRESAKTGFHGLAHRVAGMTADALLFADASHTFSHGVNTIDTYNIGRIRNGQIVPTAEPRPIEGRYPGIGVILGNKSFGHHAAYEAAQLVKEKARKNGIAKVYVEAGNHFGAAGYWSYLISQDGDLAALVNCTGSAFVAPYGGLNPALGTNPIAWSVPFDNGLMNLDMATALHASNYTIKALKEKWGRLPFPVAKFTGDGILVTDNPADFGYSVEVFLKTGGGLPLGYNNNEYNEGYKGSGLAWMIKADGVLGGEFAGVISSDPAKRKKEHTATHMFMAQVLDFHHASVEEARKEVALMIDKTKKEANGNVFYPGELEHLARLESNRLGVLQTDDTMEILNNYGRLHGLKGVAPNKS